MSTTSSKEARHGDSTTIIVREAARETADKIRMDSGGYYDLYLLLERAFQSAIDKETEELRKDRDLWKAQSEFESKHREKYRQRLMSRAALPQRSEPETVFTSAPVFEAPVLPVSGATNKD
jgi:hypothetical protein